MNSLLAHSSNEYMNTENIPWADTSGISRLFLANTKYMLRIGGLQIQIGLELSAIKNFFNHARASFHIWQERPVLGLHAVNTSELPPTYLRVSLISVSLTLTNERIFRDILRIFLENKWIFAKSVRDFYTKIPPSPSIK